MASLKCLASFCLLFNVVITGSFLSATADCNPSGNIVCNGQSYPQYACSPPVWSYTRGQLTLNDFSEGADGGDRSECDNQFHDKNEFVAALSTGWYDGGSRCGKMIVISVLPNGRSVAAKVVDECDSVKGCDAEHGGLPPCGNNIVDASAAVWDALGLDHSLGIVDILWITAA